MTVYHKIDSVFKRDPNNKFKTFLEGDWSRPEFGYLANNEWQWTEKVDGCNLRIITTAFSYTDVISGEERKTYKTSFEGREANSQIPATLVNKLNEIFLPVAGKLHEIFPHGGVLYGEGYGAKIQRGGSNYGPDQNFILFDVNIKDENGKGWWLQRENVLDIGAQLNLAVVPLIGKGTLHEMIEFTREGFPSVWSTDKNPFKAEGIVARPAIELVGRDGKRIITKVKYKDFV